MISLITSQNDLISNKENEVNNTLLNMCGERHTLVIGSVKLFSQILTQIRTVHVSENFFQIKIFPSLFQIIPAFVCLVFKSENK